MRHLWQEVCLLCKALLFDRPRVKYTGQGTRIRVDLPTGGFIELEKSNDPTAKMGYVRIHLGKPKRVHYLDETYKYVHYGTNGDNLRLLSKLRIALMELDDKYKELHRSGHYLP